MNIGRLTLREYKLLSCDIGYVTSLDRLRLLESLGLVTNISQHVGKRGGKLMLWEYETTERGRELKRSFTI